MIHHVGVVVTEEGAKHLLQAFSLFQPLRLVDQGRVEQWKCHCYLYQVGGLHPAFDRRYSSGTLLEIVVPDLKSSLFKWLKEPTSLHHIAVSVTDIAAVCSYLEKLKVPLLEKKPVKTIAGMTVNFIHPSYTGMLIELVQQS